MKKILFIMMLGLMFGQSRTIISSESIDENNPCKDEKFIMLKEKQLDEMSEREYKYFSTLTTQIYLYDYLVSFLFALYFVDVLNLINGLF